MTLSSKAQFFGGLDTVIKALVTRWAEYPDILATHVFCERTPRAIAGAFVRKFNNSTFSARFADFQSFWIFAKEATCYTFLFAFLRLLFIEFYRPTAVSLRFAVRQTFRGFYSRTASAKDSVLRAAISPTTFYFWLPTLDSKWSITPETFTLYRRHISPCLRLAGIAPLYGFPIGNKRLSAALTDGFEWFSYSCVFRIHAFYYSMKVESWL